MQVMQSELWPPPLKAEEKSVSDEFQMITSSIKAQVWEEDKQFKTSYEAHL